VSSIFIFIYFLFLNVGYIGIAVQLLCKSCANNISLS
jgi:hypothetical protein